MHALDARQDGLSSLRSRLHTRFGRVLTAGFGAMLSRVISMLAPLVTIPITLEHLGEEGFGLWMTIVSLTTLLAFADLGLGNSILSDISKALGAENRREVQVILSTTYMAIGVICLLLLPLGITLALTIDWGRHFGIKDAAVSLQAPKAMFVAVFLFIIGVPSALIYKVQIAFQQAFAANLWQAAGSLTGMALIVAAVKAKLSLTFIVGAFFGGPVLVWALATAWFFSGRGRDVRPSFALIERSIFQRLIRQSSEFFAVGVLLALGTSLDTFLVSKIAGLESGARFAIALRIATLLSLVPTMMYMPLWAANGEAIGRGDYNWVRKTVFKMTMLCLAITVVISIPIMAGSESLLRIWLGKVVAISNVLIGGLFLWALLQSGAAPRFMALNALSIIRPQVWIYLVFFAVALPAKVVGLGKWGVESVPWINATVYAIVILPIIEVLYRQNMSSREMERRTK